jgi:cytidyltransferase-like protein
MEKTVIILSGGFDPVHKGHVRMFKDAKEFPSTVVIGLNSDRWLTRKKGKPFMDWDERKEILDVMSCVDEVYSFNDDDDSACDLIRKVREQYKDSEDIKLYFGNGGDRTDSNSPEVDYCNKNNIDLLWGVGGGKIQSSSDLLKKSKA